MQLLFNCYSEKAYKGEVQAVRRGHDLGALIQYGVREGLFEDVMFIK